DLLEGVLEVGHSDFAAIVADGEHPGFGREALDLRAAESFGEFGEFRELHTVVEVHSPSMNGEDLLAALDVEFWHLDQPVEAARTENRAIEHVEAIRRGDDRDIAAFFEAVHL